MLKQTYFGDGENCGVELTGVIFSDILRHDKMISINISPIVMGQQIHLCESCCIIYGERQQKEHYDEAIIRLHSAIKDIKSKIIEGKLQ